MLCALKHVAWTGLAAGLLGVGTAPALGQTILTAGDCGPAPLPPVAGPVSSGPSTMPTTPQTPPSLTPETTAPTPQTTAPTPEATNPGLDVASLGGGSSLGLGGGTASFAAPGGYLDNAIPMTMFRLRYDAGFNMNRPDRAEFFYGAWQELSFHNHGIVDDGQFKGIMFDPKAKGPFQLPARLDYQEASAYMEYAPSQRFSAFVDIPVRYVDFDNLHEDPDVETPAERARFPETRFQEELAALQHNNHMGLSDIVAGFKYALVADPCEYLTFQFSVYTPTGDAIKGLGTGHVSLEPGLIYYQRLADRIELQAMIKDWIPVGGTALEGNVLTYGVGLGYDIYTSNNVRIVPITEFVGWTVLNGFESFFGPVPGPDTLVPDDHGVEDASGTTIVNAKVGVRTYFRGGSDLYVGYGRALTGPRWYQDIVRVEYRFKF